MKNNIDKIITRQFRGKLTEEEKFLFKEWLDKDENRSLFEDLKKTWNLTGNLNFNIEPDIDKEWKRFNNLKEDQTEIDYLKSYDVSSKSSPVIVWSIRIAASVIILIGIYFSYSIYQNYQDRIIAIETGKETRDILLPDNTKILLNKDSKITYKNDFQENRTINFAGEAFFEVQKGSNPFVIKTKDSYAEVLGTVFNLKARLNANSTELLVIEGEVKFGERKKNQKRVIVEKGHFASLNSTSNNIILSKSDDPNIISWKTGKLVFQNYQMDEVIKVLENHYDIIIQSDKKILNYRYTGNFENADIEEVLNIISLSLGIKYTHEKNNIKFYFAD